MKVVKATIVAVMLMTALALAGCAKSHGAAAGHLASAKASASALATNPAVVHDKQLAQQALQSCVTSANVIAHPVKDRKAFEKCMAQHGYDKAKVTSCVQTALFMTGGTAAREVAFVNCVARK